MVEEEEVEGVAGAPLSSVFLVAEEDDMVVAAGALGLMGGSMDLMDLGDSIGRRRGVDPVGASAAVVGGGPEEQEILELPILLPQVLDIPVKSRQLLVDLVSQ